MLKQFKSDNNQASGSAVAKAQQPKEEVKKQAPPQNFYQRGAPHGNNSEEEDDIKEDIVEDIGGVDDNQLAQGRQQLLQVPNDAEGGVGASTSLGIDQSIDTLRLEEYDYIEEVRFY